MNKHKFFSAVTLAHLIAIPQLQLTMMLAGTALAISGVLSNARERVRWGGAIQIATAAATHAQNYFSTQQNEVSAEMPCIQQNEILTQAPEPIQPGL